MMVGLRCSVKSLAEFAASSRPAKVIRYCTDPEVFIISNGTSQVFTCGSVGHGVTAAHQFPGRVTQIVPSAALGGVYTLCERDGIYFTPLPQLRSSTQPFAPSLGGCLRVSAESCVLQDREIQTFLVVKKVLVTVALGVGVWRFSLYEVPALSLPHCRKLAEVSIPAVSTAGLSAAARSGHQGVLPVLCCVQVQSRASTPLQEDGHFSWSHSFLAFSLAWTHPSSLLP
ncbi:hypothetical protein AGOR_G00195590 [Albula goreensis]|uniref:Uncharacterized protein n=1 Tax=Albula goreensis TaxID=1534307 RepID=A0A8T3CR46_9TELE|nr:hypothetical protein AGOR_G00195590 [Albula goreensis]